MIARQLSDRFRELTDNMDRMKTSAEEVDSANQGGTKAIHGLREKSQLTDEANNQIGVVIDELNNKTQDIGAILDTISSISEQTNLLALNASMKRHAPANTAGDLRSWLKKSENWLKNLPRRLIKSGILS